ncbi:malonate utilization transcriptional regulator [Buttiauxella brennerae ATCC 51605]|uniref:Malonate utilization transcriptional regulator n=2 Tax=Enterobacteriaceae TaxID=543 RepID=A0A1B7IEH3_9ENTR|nr:malonate utilization transcriptional regulator [Buttiauxella brennerae ATCC 51605]
MAILLGETFGKLMKIDAEITFRKLEIFMAFMEKGNIARTAETLGISGVSVHRALHTLEEGVRCPLFIHKGRNLVPLPSAYTLLEHSQEAVALMARGIAETRQAAGVGQGRLRIGTLYSLTLETVPRLIMGMKLRRPELEMDLTMGSNQLLLNMLEDGVLDAILISISESEIDRNRLEVLPLFHDDIFLAATSSFPLDTSKLADLRDYRDEKFVSLAEGFATYNGFQEAFHIAGFEPEIVTRVNDIFSMISLVQAGVGLALMPGRMKKVYENSVQLLKLAEPYQMQQSIAIVFARNRELDPNLLALAAEGRMYARSFIDTPNAPL